MFFKQPKCGASEFLQCERWEGRWNMGVYYYLEYNIAAMYRGDVSTILSGKKKKKSQYFFPDTKKWY